MPNKITLCLWFDGDAEEAAAFYVTLLPDSRIDRIVRSATETPSGPEGNVLVIEESACGWCKDRWGLSWQVTPRRLIELNTDPDPDRAGRSMQAMMGMHKIDIAALENAVPGY